MFDVLGDGGCDVDIVVLDYWVGVVEFFEFGDLVYVFVGFEVLGFGGWFIVVDVVVIWFVEVGLVGCVLNGCVFVV